MNQQHTIAAILRQERNERIRRARNGKFYASAEGISDLARSRWTASVREFVREARDLNRQAISQ